MVIIIMLSPDFTRHAEKKIDMVAMTMTLFITSQTDAYATYVKRFCAILTWLFAVVFISAALASPTIKPCIRGRKYALHLIAKRRTF